MPGEAGSFPGELLLHNSISAKIWNSMSPEMSVSLTQQPLVLFPREAGFSRLPIKYLHTLLIQERIKITFGEFHHI